MIHIAWVVILYIFISITPSCGTIVFVSALRNNSTNLCGSLQHPCATIQQAVNIASNGDIIELLNDGVYHDINVLVPANKTCISFRGSSFNTTWKCSYHNITNSNSTFQRALTFLSTTSSCAHSILIANITFANCKYVSMPVESGDGGGAIKLQNENIELSIQNCNFFNCSVSSNMGGALFISAKRLEIVSCKFHDCLVYSSFAQPAKILSGGAIYYEHLHRAGNFSVVHSEFINNTVIGSPTVMNGGAIYCLTAYSTLLECKFTNNKLISTGDQQHANGGAIYTTGYYLQFHVSECCFSSNKVYGSYSSYGGTFFLDADAVMIQDSNFSDNSAYGFGMDALSDERGGSGISKGGSIYVQNVRLFSMNNSSLINNECVSGESTTTADSNISRGAALYIDMSAFVSLKNVTASKNTAKTGGSTKFQAKQAAGGAFFLQGIQFYMESIFITNNTCMGGYGVAAGGGASGILNIVILSYLPWNITIDRLFMLGNKIMGGDTITGESGHSNGIICMEVFPYIDVSQAGNISISSSVIRRNLISPGKGIIMGKCGAVLRFINNVPNKVLLIINDTILENNKAGRDGKVEFGLPLMGGSVELQNITAGFYSFNISKEIAINTNGFGGGGVVFANNSNILWTDSTISDCEMVVGNTRIGYGGGLYVNYSSLILRNIEFHNISLVTSNSENHCDCPFTVENLRQVSYTSDNEITHSFCGGALFAIGSEISVVDCKFSENKIIIGSSNKSGSGGAIYVINTQIVVQGSMFANNSVGSAEFNGCKTLQLSKLSLTLGLALHVRLLHQFIWFDGGAIGIGENSFVNISHTNFYHNIAEFSGGALAVVGGFVTLSVESSISEDNISCYFGGALSIFNAGSIKSIFVKVGSSMFSGSKSMRGGHIAVSVNQDLTVLDIIDSTLTNGESQYGGVFWVENTEYLSNSFPLDVFDSNITNNYAIMGGGIIGLDSATDQNLNVLCNGSCVIANNTAAYGNIIATPLKQLEIQCTQPQVSLANETFSVSGYFLDNFGNKVQGPLFDILGEPVIATISANCSLVVSQVSSSSIFNASGDIEFSNLYLMGQNSSLCTVYMHSSVSSLSKEYMGSCEILLNGCPQHYYISAENGYDYCLPKTTFCTDHNCAVGLLIVVILVLLSLLFMLALYAATKKFQRWRRIKTVIPSVLQYGKTLTIMELINDPDIPVISSSCVKIGKIVGTGSQGCVWEGILLENSKTVAIKQLHIRDMDQREVTAFCTEIKLMSVLDHPNICSLLGILILGEKEIGMISPFMSNGSLSSFLKEKSKNIPMKMRLDFLIDISRGLSYLHSHSIVHRDLKPENCLITDDFRVVITDFGCSTVLNENQTRTLTVIGTPVYMAPEVLSNSKYTNKIDVFSLGIIMNQVITLNEPYNSEEFTGMHSNKLFDLVINGAARPFLDPSLPPTIRTLIQECWDGNPSIRPNADEALQRLERFKNIQLFIEDQVV